MIGVPANNKMGSTYYFREGTPLNYFAGCKGLCKVKFVTQLKAHSNVYEPSLLDMPTLGVKVVCDFPCLAGQLRALRHGDDLR
jgi:hypothetical protein